MDGWPLSICADVVDAATACSAALQEAPPASLRAMFLDEALVLLAEAEELLVGREMAEAVEALFAALGLLSDGIDAAEPSPHGDEAARALDLATRAVAAASAR